LISYFYIEQIYHLQIREEKSLIQFAIAKPSGPTSPPSICQEKSILKQEYRSEIGIAIDILGVTMDGGAQGVIVSAISRRANLSHNQSIEKCQKLVDAGILEPTRRGKNRLYRITEMGIKFFPEFKRFQEMAQNMNLRV
jgi:predicted transcriptional regulator